MASASLMDNMLFGRISHKHADGSKRIRSIVSSLFESLGLLENVIDIGLDFNVGAGGKRLTAVQRQKLNLARALVRRSDYYIFNRPLPGARPPPAGRNRPRRAEAGAPGRTRSGGDLGAFEYRAGEPFRPRPGLRPGHARGGRDTCGTC